MPSTNIVEVCEVREKRAIPGADRLEALVIKGWQVVAQKNVTEVGQKVVYIPPDSVITEEYAAKLGIAKYCSPLGRGLDGIRPPGYRVRAVRLRGAPSFGTIDTDVPADWEVGKDVAAILDVRKWEPPVPTAIGDAATPHPAFHTYTDVENVRNFPDVLRPGEEVVMTEKLHGMNCRVGLVRTAEGVQLMAGSRTVRRKPPAEGAPTSLYWRPATTLVRDMLAALAGIEDHDVVIFGELVNTQKGFRYGCPAGQQAFHAFDISVDGAYLGYDAFAAVCKDWGVATAPVAYRGPFSWEELEKASAGPTMMCGPEHAGDFKGREGVVVRPALERFDHRLGGSGRVVLKSISVDYLDYKTGGGKDDADASDA